MYPCDLTDFLENLIQKEIGSLIKHKIISEPTLEIVKQLMDSSLLKQETGWSPKYNMKNNMNFNLSKNSTSSTTKINERII